MAVDLRKVLIGVAVFLLCSSPLYASRVKDLGSSQNGDNECRGNASCLCPSQSIPSSATPFLAPLDGNNSPPPGCYKDNGDANQPNPPSKYPKRIVMLNDAAGRFNVTITPVLWEFGDFPASTKHTILQVQFTGQPGMTLRSLVIGTVLGHPTYVVCQGQDPQGGTFPYCSTVATKEAEALEATAVTLADNTTTRWDFYQFASGGANLSLVVDGFPMEFRDIDIFPSSNALSPASFSPSNFLAVVQDASGNTLTAGGLILPIAPPATNDVFDANRTPITLPFHAFVDTSKTKPQEDPVTGAEKPSQGDPTPGCSPYNGRVFRSVWYTLTGTGTPVTISTQGSRYDTLIYVFTGSPASPTPVACNDDGLGSGIGAVSSDVTFNAYPNTNYNIMISETPPDILDLSDGSGTVAVPLGNDATLNLSVMATPGFASYDSTLGAPLCGLVGRGCDSGPSLLLGKDNMLGGAELNQPNTIHNSCADGTAGTFHVDESIDRLTVTAASGSLRQGTIVSVSATVWVADPTQDALDLYYTTNANNPDWSYIVTLLPQASGSQTLSASFRLGVGHLQAVRASFRKGGTVSSCSTGDYDDHDDLVFAVH